MANIVLTEQQLKRLKSKLKENHDGSYMAKQQMFTIATLAYKMWEMMEDGEQLDDWMESKIAQAEQSVVAVVKAYMYDEVEESLGGMEKLDYSDLVIGK
jgi:predicted Holliday junction resolvase-like endonuclease